MATMRINTKQYLSEQILKSLDTAGDYEPISTDSYDESQILESIKKVDAKQCMGLAVQFAVVGMGNRAYGKIMIDGKEYNCIDLARQNGVKVSNKLNDKLAPGELTIKRLARFFRYHIRDYLRVTKRVSYLYRKYCVDSETDSSLIFPGAEHMAEGADSIALFKTYTEVDARLNTKFVERIRRVYQARGIII